MPASYKLLLGIFNISCPLLIKTAKLAAAWACGKKPLKSQNSCYPISRENGSLLKDDFGQHTAGVTTEARYTKNVCPTNNSHASVFHTQLLKDRSLATFSLLPVN
jgi:hypothetical protein